MAGIEVFPQDEALLALDVLVHGAHESIDIGVLIARDEQNDADFVLVFEPMGDIAFGLGVKVLVGRTDPFNLLGLLLLLILDALLLGHFGVFGFGDGLGFALLLEMSLFFGFACPLEPFVFLLMVGNHSWHC